MKNKLLVLIFIFTLLPVISWGQSDITNVDLGSEGYTGYTIEKDGTYHFTGTFTGIPGQAINESKDVKAVINIAKDITATIILEDVNISLTGENQCPLFAGDATKITLEIKGENTLSIINRNGNSPGLWVPEGKGKKITIQDADGGNNGILTVQGANKFPGIGVELTDRESNITINSGIVNAKGGTDDAGIEVNSNSELTINGGVITAKGGDFSAGIGGGKDESGGKCTITGGTVTANGGNGGAGIGGGNNGDGGTCTITSGIVTANGGSSGAGIGGGHHKTGGTCTITGGIVTANGGYRAAGIGAGNEKAGGICTITGGTVTANGGDNATGIGNGSWSFGTSTFSTKDDQGNSGNAFIITNGITDNADNKKNDWHGVIFEGNNNGKVYGSSITLTTDAVVPSDKTLDIESKQTLTIDKDITLVSSGTIVNNGTITNNGKILNIDGNSISSSGQLNGETKTGYKITYKSNDNSSTLDEISYIESGAALATNIFTRSYYTFEGWYEEAGCNTKVEKVTESITVYAKWEPNGFTLSTAAEQKLTYKQAMTEYDLSKLLSTDAVKNCGAITYKVKIGSTLPSGLSLNGTIISGTPNAATAGEVTVTITAAAANTSAVDILITFTVAKKELVITPVTNQSIYKNEVATYEPLFDTDIKDDKEGMTYTGKLAWNTDNHITIGNLVFDNYEPKLSSSPVSITIKDSDIPVNITSTPNINDWYTNNIILTAPEGFKISGNGRTRTVDWQPSITISEEGIYEYAYSLLRDKQTTPVNKTISVKLDKTAPALSYTTDNLNYTLTFSDAGSGIDKLYIDDAEITPASGATTYIATGTAGTHTARVTDKAGLSREVSFELKDDDPYVPPYEPDPVITYTVTLPAVEGITTDPVAGDYSVERYSSFSFSLTIAEGYREQSIPVVKVNGNVFDPVDADGHYKIKFIRSDQSVTVEGILADNPTASENLSTPAFELRTEGHTLCITVAQPRLCRLFDPSGRLICSRQLTPGINRLEGLAAGIYIVVVERKGVRKIVVQ